MRAKLATTLVALIGLRCSCIAAYSLQRQVLVIAGNFTLNNVMTNLAQYDLESGIWSTEYEPELYLYGESNGVVWDVAVNRSTVPYNKLIVVGEFDTVRRTSQVQFCSVGAWDGFTFGKVGEGLCPRGGDSSSTMFIQTTVLGNDGDLFVGGTFESRVWDGKHFVSVYNIAHFDDKLSSWLPLLGGPLSCDDSCTPRVKALAWDAINGILFIGGVFNMIDGSPIPPGIAMWSEKTGLMAFPGGGLTLSLDNSHASSSSNGTNSLLDGHAAALEFEPRSQSLFVAGTFRYVDGQECSTIAVWEMSPGKWKCLYDQSHGISTVTAMLYSADSLYLAGWAAPSSSWDGKVNLAPYAIATLDVARYIEERFKGHSTRAPSPAPTAAPSASGLPNSNSSQVVDTTEPEGKNSSVVGRNHTDAPSALSRRRLTHLQERLTVRVPRRRLDVEVPPGYRHRRHHVTPYLADNSTLVNSVASLSIRRLRRLRADEQLTPPPPPVAPKSNYTFTPTVAPSKGHWVMNWTWLPAFPGGNGPILRLMLGEGEYEGCLFISGAFNNLPAVTAWTNDPLKGPSIVGVGPGEQLRGLITTIRQVTLPLADAPAPTIQPPVIPNKKNDRLAVAFLASVAILVLLGVGFAVGFLHSKGFLTFPYQPIEESKEELMISLKTLSGSHNAVVDFKECFERAMTARHLPIHENLLVINPKEILLSKIIGEGSFGRVWSGKWGNNRVAVKEFVFAQAAMAGGSLQRDSIIEEIVGEAGIMAFLRHPKILQIYGCSLTMQAIWIVSELCSRGSLRMLLNDKSIDLTLTKKLSMCLDVADGMLYLHTRYPPIIHRDIKSHNIFITELAPGNFVAKIGDWGSARAVALGGSKTLTHGVGTACWLAPEVINHAHSSKHSDVFAFGIVLWEMYTRQEVYEGLSAAQIIAKVAHDNLRPVVPRDCPWAAIMTDCWKQNANERPGFHSIMASLGKLYARCKAGGGRTRGLGLTSVSSSPALSSLASESNTLPGGRRPPTQARLTSMTKADFMAMKKSPAGTPSTENEPLLGANTKVDYESYSTQSVADARRPSKIHSNPVKQVPFETTYSPYSKTDEVLQARAQRALHAAEHSIHSTHSTPPIATANSPPAMNPQQDTFFIGSASSSGSTIVSSVIERGQLHKGAEDAANATPGETGHFRLSMGSMSSRSLNIEDYTPFSKEAVDAAKGGDANTAGYEPYDWNEYLDLEEAAEHPVTAQTPDAMSFSREETPQVYLLNKNISSGSDPSSPEAADAFNEVPPPRVSPNTSTTSMIGAPGNSPSRPIPRRVTPTSSDRLDDILGDSKKLHS